MAENDYIKYQQTSHVNTDPMYGDTILVFAPNARIS